MQNQFSDLFLLVPFFDYFNLRLTWLIMDFFNQPTPTVFRSTVFPFTVQYLRHMYSQLSRCRTAGGSSTGLFCVGPTKVKACKSLLFTDGPLKVENKEHLVDLGVTH